MNELEKLIDSITESDLVIMLQELTEFEKTGILKSGKVRTFSEKYAEIANHAPLSSILIHARVVILRKAAYLWLVGHDKS